MIRGLRDSGLFQFVETLQAPKCQDKTHTGTDLMECVPQHKPKHSVINTTWLLKYHREPFKAKVFFQGSLLWDHFTQSERIMRTSVSGGEILSQSKTALLGFWIEYWFLAVVSDRTVGTWFWAILWIFALCLGVTRWEYFPEFTFCIPC